MTSRREAHLEQLIPQFTKIKESNVLVVGAGGIGCELLKNIVMTGFQRITVIDLDTIDLSNLNRQFLFQHQHIKKPKSLVAKESVLKFNPNVDITAYHASIYEARFGLEWFKGFDIVLNALDNLQARRHVNKMCLAAGVPLIESGTAGYHGQVSVHHYPFTSCYDCTSKPIEKKTYPVCTIRSTPSEPIHTIVWAKNYLFNALFGRMEKEEEIDPNAENGIHVSFSKRVGKCTKGKQGDERDTFQVFGKGYRHKDIGKGIQQRYSTAFGYGRFMENTRKACQVGYQELKTKKAHLSGIRF
jgi:ubiquitin-like 1-activating enzyme E1 B